MKKLIIVLMTVLATTACTKKTHLHSFCGFVFGSYSSQPDSRVLVIPGIPVVETQPLPKPFMRFKNARLSYGARTKRLFSIGLYGEYPEDTTLSTVKNDASRLMDTLKKKYGLRFLRDESEANKYVLSYSTDPFSDTLIYIHIAKCETRFFLGVDAFDGPLLRDERERDDVYDSL